MSGAETSFTSMDMFARTLVKSCCIHPLAPAAEACSSADLPLET